MTTKTLDTSSREILMDVLEDFRSQNLGTEHLSEEYRGPSLSELKTKFCANGRHSSVDFDLAVKELEEGDFVGTGPQVPFDNDPNSDVFVLSLMNKKEFVYLTEKGYRESQKTPVEKRPPAPTVYISGGNFQNSPLAIGDNIQQTTTINVHNDAEVVSYLTNLLARQTPSPGESKRKEIEELVGAARAGDLPAATSIFKRLFGFATETVKGLAYAVIAEIIKSQFGS